MTPAEMAELHARCFTAPRPYSETDFAEFLASPFCFLCIAPHGFILGRTVADEAEVLTLAVDPAYRQLGIARALLLEFEKTAKLRGAAKIWLEVASGNVAALSLYRRANFRESGRRTSYYRRPDGTNLDAILMEKRLDLA